MTTARRAVGPYLAAHPVFTTAEAAVGAMSSGWHELGDALRSASDEQLEQPVRLRTYDPGPGPMGTGCQVIAALLNEVSHHGTQIGVLRDLYRLRAGAPIARRTD